MMLRTLLVLGRVSNLPTVWTNALAGAVLSQAVPGLGTTELILVMVALSLFYIGGMYLNDAFDAEIDAAERSVRPIPSGQISRGAVFAIGYGCLAVGIALGFWFNIATGLAGIALAVAVFLYDWLHKKTALAPLFMGACRALSYAMAALAAGDITTALWIGAAGLFAHVVGLTYAAKQEAYDRIGAVWPLAVLALPAIAASWLIHNPYFVNMIGWGLLAVYGAWTLWALRFLFRRRPGDVPRAVISLIAGIALFDAVMIAAMGATVLAVFAIVGFGLTLALQRVVPGT
ncbi:MAG: UbiA family prenyltransferase [Pseudomonadota bacterium]